MELDPIVSRLPVVEPLVAESLTYLQVFDGGDVYMETVRFASGAPRDLLLLSALRYFDEIGLNVALVRESWESTHFLENDQGFETRVQLECSRGEGFCDEPGGLACRTEETVEDHLCRVHLQRRWRPNPEAGWPARGARRRDAEPP